MAPKAATPRIDSAPPKQERQKAASKAKPVAEQPKGRRKKKQAANADDLDRVISNRAAALFGSKTLKLDSQWFD